MNNTNYLTLPPLSFERGKKKNRMKTEILVKKEVDIKYVQLNVAVRYDEEDMPNNFPFRDGKMWNPKIEIDTGKIVDWPFGIKHDLHMKICDEGSYHLIDDSGITILSIENDYVPNGLIPGKYGDYIVMNILEDGIISNWPKEPSIEEFNEANYFS